MFLFSQVTGLVRNETPSPPVYSCEALDGFLMIQGINKHKLLPGARPGLKWLRILFVSR